MARNPEFEAYMQRAARLEAERPELSALGKCLYLEDCARSVGIDPEVGWASRGIRAHYVLRAERLASLGAWAGEVTD